MKLQPNETSLRGKWEVRGGTVVPDDVCRRIEALKDHHLNRIATDASGWDTLYRDPLDGRYWELVYLESEMNGGGPPSLLYVDNGAARSKYGVGA